MAVFGSDCLEEANRRQIARRQRVEEVVKVVLVVGAAIVRRADSFYRTRALMHRIGCGRPILEKRVVRNVIVGEFIEVVAGAWVGGAREARPTATCGPVWVC